MNQHLPPQDEHRRKLELARQLTRLLDNAIVIPGTNQKVGLDPLLGLLPGIGDLVSLGVSLYLIYLARQMGVSRWGLSAMVLNVVLDTIIGAIPIAGDAFDLFWKSNTKNMAILERHLEKTQGKLPTAQASKQKPSHTSQGPQPPGEQTIDVAAGHPQMDKS